MTSRVALALLLIACAKPASSVSAPSGGGGGGGGNTNGGTGPAASAGVAAGNAAGTAGAASGSAGEAWMDTFDPSGCDHPAISPDCMNGWCKIPAGCFVMGSPENEWTHAPQQRRAKTTLTRAFLMQATEVTQKDWTDAGLANPSGTIDDPNGDFGQGECIGDTCPVGNVNWFEAVSYANLLSEKEGLAPCYTLKGCKGTIGVGYGGLYCDSFEITTDTIYTCKGYRLPTDAEWEYAARAGAKTAFYNGEMTTRAEVGVCVAEPALESIAWYCSNTDKLAHPVKELQPNAWGLYDVLGNILEWAHDQSGWTAASETLTDPDQTYGSGQGRDMRGGFRGLAPAQLRLANRLGLSASFKAHGFGFRLARTAP
jgi:sulfatase modifying factor 1